MGTLNMSSTTQSLDIFISHSSSDAKIAELLIDLIRTAYPISAKKIRCTSVNGYRLFSGAQTESQLREEIISSKLLIAIITPQSIESTYVMFELGARWGLKLPLVPIVSSDEGLKLLKGPLSGINAMSAHDTAQLFQLIENIGVYLNLVCESPAVYDNKVQNLVNFLLNKIVAKTIDSNIAMQTSESEIYEDCELIIKQEAAKLYPNDFQMQVFIIKEQREAVKKLKKGNFQNIPNDIFNNIRNDAEARYPKDYSMRLFVENEQIEAYLELLKS